MDKLDKSIKVMKLLKNLRDETAKSLIKDFKGIDITAPQVMVIEIIGIEGSMKVSDISKEMSLSNSTVSGIIDRLEKKGCVTRVRSNTDRRVVNVKLSESFIKQNREKLINEDWFTGIIEKTSEAELDNILLGFNTLIDLLEKNK